MRILIYTCTFPLFFCLISNSLVSQIYTLPKSMILVLSFYIHSNNFKSTVPQNPSFFCLLVFQIYTSSKPMIFLLSFYSSQYNFKSTVHPNLSFICLLGFKSTLHPKPWFFFCLIHKKPNQHLFISMVFLPYQFFLSISNLHFIQTHDFFA